MSRNISILITLVFAVPFGIWVFRQLASFFKGYIPYYGGLMASLVVFLLFYYLLIRPIVNQLADRFYWLSQRKTKTRMGAGLGEIPQTPTQTRRTSGASKVVIQDIPTKPLDPKVKCRFCGKPGAEVCQECAKEWGFQ